MTSHNNHWNKEVQLNKKRREKGKRKLIGRGVMEKERSLQ
jgi:hypothetical protein